MYTFRDTLVGRRDFADKFLLQRASIVLQPLVPQLGAIPEVSVVWPVEVPGGNLGIQVAFVQVLPGSLASTEGKWEIS